MIRYFAILTISFLLLNCRNKEEVIINDYREQGNIKLYCKFPDTVKLGEKYIAEYLFVNSTFDTIIEPRVKESVKYRFLLFSEYYPESENHLNSRIYSDSILLDKNSLKLSYEFEEVGTFFIGGLIRDELYYDYRFIKPDSLLKFDTHKVVSKKVTVIN